MTLRAALYYTPDPTDPLTQAGNIWLGRDPERATTLPQPPIPNIADLTAAPATYGFHATLRPPMRLATGWEEFLTTAHQIAAQTTPFTLPPLAVTNLDGFLALQLTAPCPAIHTLADACVTATNPHRLPPADAELTRRRAAGLSPRQENMLSQWGYPYVMQDWRFHITLSRRLNPAELNTLHPAAQTHFAAALALPRRVSTLTIFTQRDTAPFLIAERLRLGAQ